MKKPPDASSERSGTPGLDIFKIASQSISGYIPGFKTGNKREIRFPYTSTPEQKLAIYLEYHPHVSFYQRGDASEAFARARHLHTPLGTPYPIGYFYEGNAHAYLPDFVGTLCDGKLFIAEAGLEEQKSKGQALAKAEAARRLAQLKGGVYWIGTEKNLSLKRHRNLLFLHTRRETFRAYDEIEATLLAYWPRGEFSSVSELVQRFGSRWSDHEVEAAVWKLVGDAAAEGRLLVDLTEVELSLTAPLALLDLELPPILPDPLPSSLEAEDEEIAPVPLVPTDIDAPLAQAGSLGGTFDDSTLEPEVRTRFQRNLAAVTDVLNGKSVRQAAEEHGMAVATLSRLQARVKAHGQMACVPMGVYHREREIHPELQRLIRKLYTQVMRPTIQAVYEDVRLKNLAKELSEREGILVRTPTYKQVYAFLKSIEQEPQVVEARSGLKHPPRGRTSPQSYVLSIPFPAFICQVDEHTLDQLIVAADGTPITRRVHGAVLICVKTAAILGAVLSLDTLTEEDYMRLIKQALEPKDELVIRYGCKHSWPCTGKPAVIFHDRGKIFTSERATQVVVDRLKITTEQAPPFAPSAKGTVEALFTWTTRKFEHRLAGTTKSTPQDRGAYDSVREAKKAGMTLDVLEELFTQAIVDGYMQEWNDLRRQTPVALWQESVREKGVLPWLGSRDDLKLLLMKAQNRQNRETGRYAITENRISFLGRHYVGPGILDRLRGKEIDIYYDRRDITVIYLFLEGELVGEAYCTQYLNRRVSWWEARAERRADAALKEVATAESLENRQDIQQKATAGKRIHSLETKRLEKQRQLDRQRQDIHPEHVQEVLQALAKEQATPPTRPPVSRLLAPAVPREDPPGASIEHLPIRDLRGDDDDATF
ncbi:MAG TPA: Mu transposase C-terminal domain-containing protein [Ktedonobacteraceae bacterium]|nr:Mu transposase C-terminal domain-containing protein [Ktedonobacteraceae bacterium]